MNTANTSAPASGRIKLYHRRHGRRQRGKSLSHLAPAAVLISSGLAVLGGEPFTWLMAAEFVVGAAYLILMVRELRQLRHNPHHHERVAWLELAAAGILGIEGYHIWHRHHEANLARGTHTFHVLPYLYWAMAVFFVVLAFSLAKLTERRHLHLHEGGFSGRLHPLGRMFQFQWAEVVSVEPAGAADLVLTRTNGQTQRISFEAMHDGPVHRDRLLAHARQAMNNEQ
ncbi:hypothetical protein [Hymenobacter saemangeumensis]